MQIFCAEIFPFRKTFFKPKIKKFSKTKHYITLFQDFKFFSFTKSFPKQKNSFTYQSFYQGFPAQTFHHLVSSKKLPKYQEEFTASTTTAGAAVRCVVE